MKKELNLNGRAVGNRQNMVLFIGYKVDPITIFKVGSWVKWQFKKWSLLTEQAAYECPPPPRRYSSLQVLKNLVAVLFCNKAPSHMSLPFYGLLRWQANNTGADTEATITTPRSNMAECPSASLLS